MRSRLWGDERGTLYEIPVLIIALLLVGAVAVPAVMKHGWRGLVTLIGLLLLCLAGIAAFVGLVWAYNRFIAPNRVMSAVIETFFGIVLRMLAGAFFVGIFDGFFFEVYPELSVGKVMAVEGALLFALSAWHTWHSRKPKVPPPAAPISYDQP